MDTILKVIKLVKELLTGDDVKIDVEHISSSLEKNLEDLSESINANSLNLYLRRELLEAIMWHLETIGLCCVLFGVIGSILRFDHNWILFFFGIEKLGSFIVL